MMTYFIILVIFYVFLILTKRPLFDDIGIWSIYSDYLLNLDTFFDGKRYYISLLLLKLLSFMRTRIIP